MARGKPHATDVHHDEPAHPAKASAKGKERMETEEDINAEPEASEEDDLRVPTPRPARPKPPPAKLLPDPELNQPKRKLSRKSFSRIPEPSMYKKGLAHKAMIDFELNQGKKKLEAVKGKENAPSPESWDGKDSVFSSDSDKHDDELSVPPSKKQKQTQTKTLYETSKKPVSPVRNLHVPPPKKAASALSKATFGAKKTYGTKRLEVPQDEDEDDDSDISMVPLSDDEPKKTVKPALKQIKSPKEIADPELRTKKPKSPSSKGEILEKLTMLDENELNRLLQDHLSSSAQPNSSAAEGVLDDIDEYRRRLDAQEGEDNICLLCIGTVEPDDYWEFWEGKPRTYKNDAAFCHFHRKKSAQKEYDENGYPVIDWDALPERIRKHRTQLHQVFSNSCPSKHRDNYEPLAMTGKAAAVPSRRKDLPADSEDESDMYNIDNPSTYPGYYGPRGRRVITECISDLFARALKRSVNPIVTRSGCITYVQAVLVPEAAIFLIMEDCNVDQDTAEEIRETTYEMGKLLNEELDDEVVAQEESEDDNEYTGT